MQWSVVCELNVVVRAGRRREEKTTSYPSSQSLVLSSLLSTCVGTPPLPPFANSSIALTELRAEAWQVSVYVHDHSAAAAHFRKQSRRALHFLCRFKDREATKPGVCELEGEGPVLGSSGEGREHDTVGQDLDVAHLLLLHAENLSLFDVKCVWSSKCETRQGEAQWGCEPGEQVWACTEKSY